MKEQEILGEEHHIWEMYKGKEMHQQHYNRISSNIEEKKQRFEIRLKRATTTDNNGHNEQHNEHNGDLLVTWLEYIKFIQDNNNNSNNNTEITFSLLERCTKSIIINHKAYHQDTRFLRICILYADRTSSPNDIYKYLYEHEIGINNSLFWVAWAWVAELNKNYIFADKIYCRGQKNGAKPLKLIENRYKQFQRRMSRHWLNNQQIDKKVDNDNNRRATTSAAHRSNNKANINNNVECSIDGNTANGRRRRRAHPSSPSLHSNQTNDKANYYAQDSSSYNDTNGDRHRHRHNLSSTISTKTRPLLNDSTTTAQRMNGRSFHKKPTTNDNNTNTHNRSMSSPISTSSSFKIFKEPNNYQLKNKPSSSSLSSSQRRYDNNNNLHNIPLQSKNTNITVNNPSSRQEQLLHDNSSNNPSKNYNSNIKNETSLNNSQIGFNKRFLLDRSANESSFEECRNKHNYFKLCNNQNNFNYLKIDAHEDNDNSSIMSISMEDEDESDNAHDDDQSFESGFHSSSTNNHTTDNKHNLSQSDIIHQQTMASRSNSSFATTSSIDTKDPTINTKLALRELSTMFVSSPLRQDISSSAQQQPRHKSFMLNDISNSNVSPPNKRYFESKIIDNKSSFSIMDDDNNIIHNDYHDDDDDNADQNNYDNSILNNNTKEQIAKRSKTVAFNSSITNNNENYIPTMKQTKQTTTSNDIKMKKRPLGTSSSPSFNQYNNNTSVFDIHQDDNNELHHSDQSSYHRKMLGKSKDDEINPKNKFSIYNEIDPKYLFYQLAESRDGCSLYKNIGTSQNYAATRPVDNSIDNMIHANNSNDSTFKTIGQPMKELNVHSNATAFSPHKDFQIFNDDSNNNIEIFNENIENSKQNNSKYSAPFEILNDENNVNISTKQNTNHDDTTNDKKFNFEINADADEAVKNNVENGDTATFSLFNEALNELDNDTTSSSSSGEKRDDCNDESKQIDSPVNRSNVSSNLSHDKSMDSSKNDGKRPSIAYLLRKRLNKSNDHSSQAKSFEKLNDKNEINKNKNNSNTFEIHMDDAVDNGNQQKVQNDSDTASFSLFNEVVQGIEGNSGKVQNNKEEKYHRKEEKKINSILDKYQLRRSTRQNSSSVISRKPQRCIKDVSALKDISRISDDDSIENDQQSDLVIIEDGDDDDVIDFDTLHKQDTIWALDQTMKEAATNCALEAKSSVDTLEWNDQSQWGKCLVEDRTSKTLPSGLSRKNPAKYTTVDLGGLVKSSVVVKYELGRGGYGVVLLCDKLDKDYQNSNSLLALKIQLPTGSLAWEYNVLTKLEERLCPSQKRRTRRYNNKTDDSLRPSLYPRALSFTLYSDGSILSMTAASVTGLTLVDVVNCHKKAGVGPVPELLAMHYTVKMLSLIESMHWHGKILHCDVKTDNWVLTPLKDQSGDSIIEGGDLMLVDFGRSIDLQRVSEETKEQPFHLRFTGNIAAKDFECIAMREGKPWGADVDTYGLCATAHALLYGSYIKVEKNHASGRWLPQKPLRRYWNKNLWNTLFDTLLNAEGRYSNGGSHPDSLRSIRKSFEEYLDQGNRRSEIRSLLRHQVDYFPSINKGSGSK